MNKIVGGRAMSKLKDRAQVILECTEHKEGGMPGTSGITINRKILAGWS